MSGEPDHLASKKYWEEIDPALIEKPAAASPHPQLTKILNKACQAFLQAYPKIPKGSSIFFHMDQLAEAWQADLPFYLNGLIHFLRGLGHYYLVLLLEPNTRQLEEASLKKTSGHLQLAISINHQLSQSYRHRAIYCFRQAAQLFWDAVKSSSQSILTLSNSFEIALSRWMFIHTIHTHPELPKQTIAFDHLFSYLIEAAQQIKIIIQAYPSASPDSENLLKKYAKLDSYLRMLSRLISSDSDPDFKIQKAHFDPSKASEIYFHFPPTEMKEALKALVLSLQAELLPTPPQTDIPVSHRPPLLARPLRKTSSHSGDLQNLCPVMPEESRGPSSTTLPPPLSQLPFFNQPNVAQAPNSSTALFSEILYDQNSVFIL